MKDTLPRQFISLRAQTRKYNRNRGLYTRVARELDLSPSHVRLVALGLRRSSKVEAVLLRELSEEAA
jgi:hypothetical protein